MDDKKKPTIYDIAKEAGVSPATVSRVLNNEKLVKSSTRQKVMAVINKYSYKKNHYIQKKIPAREIARSKDNLLFLINIATFGNPFYGDIVQGAQSAARRHGHFLSCSQMNINDLSIDSLITLIDNYNISGIINMTDMPSQILMRIQEIVPIVQCSEYSENCSFVSYVTIDNVSASKKAVSYAISTGHKKVAILNSSFRYNYARLRHMGYIQALHNAGLDANPEWCIQIPDVNFSMAYAAASKLFSLPDPPDAVFAISDIFAAAAIKAAYDANLRVPQDVIIIGFDNINISVTTTPSITTVSQPRFQLGYTAFELLLNEVMNPGAPKQQIFLDTELIIRESTKVSD